MPRNPFLFLCLAATAAVAAPNAAPPAPAAPQPSAPDAQPHMALPSDVSAPAPAGTPKFTFSQCHVDGPYVAMTFDDGPHGANTPRLLEMLKQRKIHATFFLVGQCVAEFPDIAKRIVAEGHEIANHSWSHPQLTTMSDSAVREQIQKTHDAIVNATGVTPKLLRPPYGAFNARQRAWAHSEWGYKCILWDVDPLDWKVRNAEHVKTEILKQTVPGSIILSHDIHKTTVDAMPETLDALLAKGFKFVTVSELVAMDKPVVPKPKATPAPKTAAPATAKGEAAAPEPVADAKPKP
jgi:peptidoglycan/xylan/chitin deacetylase (PgdA/CDA1 family)